LHRRHCGHPFQNHSLRSAQLHPQKTATRFGSRILRFLHVEWCLQGKVYSKKKSALRALFLEFMVFYR